MVEGMKAPQSIPCDLKSRCGNDAVRFAEGLGKFYCEQCTRKLKLMRHTKPIDASLRLQWKMFVRFRLDQAAEHMRLLAASEPDASDSFWQEMCDLMMLPQIRLMNRRDEKPVDHGLEYATHARHLLAVMERIEPNHPDIEAVRRIAGQWSPVAKTVPNEG